MENPHNHIGKLIFWRNTCGIVVSSYFNEEKQSQVLNAFIIVPGLLGVIRKHFYLSNVTDDDGFVLKYL